MDNDKLDELERVAREAMTRPEVCTPEYSAMRNAQERFSALMTPSLFLALITAARRPARPDREAVAKEIRQILTETCRGEIHAATAGILALITAARRPDGWVMVPRELTEAMEDAGREEVFKDRMGPAPRQPKHIVANNVWTAMLSAVPKETT